MEGMNVLKNAGVSLPLALCVIPVLFAGCSGSGPGVTQSRPLSSQRGVETLTFEPGEMPEWRKTGNLTVKAEGERNDAGLSLKVRVKKGDKQRTIDAKGREVEVIGNNGDLVITGGCAKLLVSGSRNQVRCDFVREIAVTGDGNRIDCDSIGAGKVEGEGNSLSWKKPVDDNSPAIDFSGINNSLEQVVPRYKRKL
jgi:hypothetical protein